MYEGSPPVLHLVCEVSHVVPQTRQLDWEVYILPVISTTCVFLMFVTSTQLTFFDCED